MKLALLVTLALAASPLAAQPLAEDPVFVEGLSLFKELEFEQAALRFEQLALDTTRPRPDRARILTWLGVCQAKTGNFEPARASFDLAVRLDREVELPVEVGPRVVKMFVDAKAAVPEPEPEPEPEPVVGPEPQPEPTPEPEVTPPEPEPIEAPKPEPVEEVKPAPEPSPLGAALWVGAGVAGVAAVVSGVVAGALISSANDLSKTQVEAVQIYDQGLIVGVGAAGLGVVALGLAAGALVVE